MDLNKKVVIITGGSKGFGKSLAYFLGKEGCQIIIASNNNVELENAKNELQCDSFIVDVMHQTNIKALGEYVFKKYGKIDIWINNAGIQIAPSLVENIEIEKIKKLFDINFFGYFYGCQTALKYMKKQEYGIIINVNSTAGLEGKPMISAYSSSKFAIKGLTESIRKELPNNINLYAIYPGGMQTEIYQEKYPDDIKEYMLPDEVATQIVANLKSDNPDADLIIKRPQSI